MILAGVVIVEFWRCQLLSSGLAGVKYKAVV